METTASPSENNYIRLVQPLTRDLDEVSKQMFALKTNGGEEYCGAVIRRSLSDLTWDSDPKTYKAIFIAGNEPFTQGPVDARSACRTAFPKASSSTPFTAENAMKASPAHGTTAPRWPAENS